VTRTRWVLVGTFLALVAVVLAPRHATEGPFVPASPDTVVERVPAGGEARRARAVARAALASKPDDVDAAVALARGYVEAARAEGNDVRLIGRAQAALAPWWGVLDAPPAVRLLRATIKQSLHDFAGARVDLDALVAANAEDAQAWLTRATVAMVVGDYAEAQKSCDALSGLVAVVCRAPLKGLKGEASAAAKEVEAALSASDPERMKAWALSVAGELHGWAGENKEAESAFAQVLQLDPADDYTRGVWADLMLDAGRAAEAAKLVAGREGNDALLLRGCEAQKESAACETLTQRVAATRQRGDVVHRREEARYTLRVEGDAAKSLALAVENFKVQREPADVRVLLEAAVAAKDKNAGAVAVEWMKRTGFQWAPLAALVKQLEAMP